MKLPLLNGLKSTIDTLRIWKINPDELKWFSAIGCEVSSHYISPNCGDYFPLGSVIFLDGNGLDEINVGRYVLKAAQPVGH
ncbi:MAG: hypothetical protein HOC81_14175 [Candidatus Marinimicrobia bacterium]|nr:hypothetical protein [Candidatus Neomarinimicrobiota bacterium]